MRMNRLLSAVLLVAAASACENALEVDNENNPDRKRVLAKPADVEGLAASQFQQIVDATTGNLARTHTGMLTAAFENASGLANNGLGPRSFMPRQPIGNGRGNAYEFENFADFRIHSGVARNMAAVLARAKTPGFTLGTTAGDEQRLRAWSHFVRGVALGNLSLVYDSAGIPRPQDEPLFIPPLEGYKAVNAEALANFDSALVYARMSGTSALPGGWLTGPGGANVSAADFIRVIRSYKARMRVGVARTPTERAAVDWNQVVADARSGIAADLVANMNPSAGWDYQWLASTLHFRDANWHQMTYYIIGMADASGGYDAWLATNRDDRRPFLIVTPDLRFPRGATRADQVRGKQGAAKNDTTPAVRDTVLRYFRNRDPGLDQASTGWQASFYDHYRWRAFADAGRIGPFPIFTRAENDMLAAEGLIRSGSIAAADTLIDRYRTRNGLPALSGVVTTATDPVPGGASCVPRVPVGPNFTSTACGTVFEAMKWEKRMETAFTTYGAWFFDSRGWGDLPEGTPVHWPVPYQELDARRKPIYDQGGAGKPGGATASSYGFGTGSR